MEKIEFVKRKIKKIGFRILLYLPEVFFLKIMYRFTIGKKLNLKKPQTFNEKLQWLKLNDRNPRYTNLVDKYLVREYVSEKIGDEYLVPLYKVYESVDEIELESLPRQFVLKCTHDSGGVILCKNKKTFDKQKEFNKLKKLLNRNYYYSTKEYPYKNIKPRIICEEYLIDEKSKDLMDYKFFCFDGKPHFMYVASNRNVETKFDFYDLEFNHLDVKQHYENSTEIIKKPKNFDQMITLATRLSKDIPHVRVDFYECNEKIYFGEMTFYHFSGFVKFEPEYYDELFGKYINIKSKKIKQN